MSKVFISITLIGLCAFSLYMYNSNQKMVKVYEARNTEWIEGTFKEYNVDETSKKVYFNFQLNEYEKKFSIPSPEWKSFDFNNFKDDVKAGTQLKIEVLKETVNAPKTYNVTQILIDHNEYIDFNKKLNKRKMEKWLSLLFAILSIAGLVHHNKHPWV